MFKFNVRQIVAGTALTSAAIFGMQNIASAEMGPTRSNVGETVAGISLSYVHADGVTMFQHRLLNPVDLDRFTNVENGFNVEGVVSHVLFQQMFGLEKVRAEAALSYSRYSQDKIQEDSAAFSRTFGPSGAQTIAPGISSQHDRNVLDVSVAMKGQRHLSDSLATAFLFEIFYRNDEQDALAGGRNVFTSLKSDAWGVMLGVQPELVISETVSLVGEISGGVYAFNAKAAIREGINATTNTTLVESETGFRGRLIGGVKVRLIDSATVTFFGGLDYWDEIAFVEPLSDLTNFADTTLKTTDLIEFKAGVNVSFPLN